MEYPTKSFLVTYKNGRSLIVKAVDMYVKDGMVYQLCRDTIFANTRASVFSAEHISCIREVEA